MKQIDKIINKLKAELDDFETTKQNYYLESATINNPNFNREKAAATFEALCAKLLAIIKISAYQANVREEADIYISPREEIIPKIGFRTKTADIEITIGLFRDFYIIGEIKNSMNLK